MKLIKLTECKYSNSVYINPEHISSMKKSECYYYVAGEMEEVKKECTDIYLISNYLYEVQEDIPTILAKL